MVGWSLSDSGLMNCQFHQISSENKDRKLMERIMFAHILGKEQIDCVEELECVYNQSFLTEDGYLHQKQLHDKKKARILKNLFPKGFLQADDISGFSTTGYSIRSLYALGMCQMHSKCSRVMWPPYIRTKLCCKTLPCIGFFGSTGQVRGPVMCFMKASTQTISLGIEHCNHT